MPSPTRAGIASDSMRRPPFSVGASASSMARMITGTPAMTWTLPILKPGAALTALTIRSAPSGIRAIRSRAAFASVPVWRQRSSSIARACEWIGNATPNAFATASAVMSSWVGPMPPVVNT